MPIREESKKEYFEARDVFVESYKDFLRKLLGLLDEAESSTGDTEVRKDVVHFADEVKTLKKNIEDFQNEDQRARRAPLSASSEGTPKGTSQEVQRASSPGEDALKQLDSTPVPIPVPSTTTSTQKSKTKTQSADSADELQAEVESAPSQLSQSEETEEAPQVFAPAIDDDGRVVSAFCAFRYHKAEFRQLFMRQGSNNSCVAAAAAAAAAARNAALVNNASSACDDLLGMPEPPEWLAPLAHYTLHLMRRAFRTATSDQWEALKTQLSGFGFKAEEHFALWLRLSASAPQDAQGQRDPGHVFNAIPPLAGLPKRLAMETKIMLQTLNLLNE